MSRLGAMERTRLPDYSIGATVLVVAIALPFFIFTRAEHLHRTGPPRPVAATATAQAEAVIASSDPTSSPSPSVRPQPVLATPSPTARPAVKPVTAAPPTVPTSPTSAPTSAPSSAPSALPDSPPIAALGLTITSGPAPLTVTADASRSSDTDQTPIAQVIFNFGDGTIVTAQGDWTATHTYNQPGTYTVAVAVIDTAHLSSTATSGVTVN